MSVSNLSLSYHLILKLRILAEDVLNQETLSKRKHVHILLSHVEILALRVSQNVEFSNVGWSHEFLQY